MLNKKKLSDLHSFTVNICTWHNDVGEQPIDGWIYSAGESKNALVLNSTYRFVLQTNIGDIPSTNYLYDTRVIRELLAYPNPVAFGRVSIEGVTVGSLIEIYNQFGRRVMTTIVTDDPATLNLNLPAGLYVIRTIDGEVKIIVEN